METLETLRLYPTDPRGRELPLNRLDVLADDFAAVSSIRHFDLSRNKFLRTLEVTGCHIDAVLRAGSPEDATSLFTYALSTITSSVFTEVTVFYPDYDFSRVKGNIIWQLSPAEIARQAS